MQTIIMSNFTGWDVSQESVIKASFWFAEMLTGLLLDPTDCKRAAGSVGRAVDRHLFTD